MQQQTWYDRRPSNQPLVHNFVPGRHIKNSVKHSHNTLQYTLYCIITSSSASRIPGERNIADRIIPNNKNRANIIRVTVEFFQEGHQVQQHPTDRGPHKQQSWKLRKHALQYFQMQTLTGMARIEPILINGCLRLYFHTDFFLVSVLSLRVTGICVAICVVYIDHVRLVSKQVVYEEANDNFALVCEV